MPEERWNEVGNKKNARRHIFPPGNNAKKDATGAGTAAGESAPRGTYTGGRQRQMKERHKNAFRQRGADRKMRGAY
ncbi:hypothetical protein COOONC_24256 [Cooperia oncophora]